MKWKNGIRVTAIVAGALIGFEILLHIISFFMTESGPSVLTVEDKAKIRILTIGESTTDVSVSHGRGWPEILEENLLKRGFNVKVINVGKAGTNSSLILSRLKEQIDTFSPQVVITMMGTNDIGNMKFDFTFTPIRTLKLIYLMKERLLPVSSCSLTPIGRVLGHHLYEDLIDTFGSKSPAELEAALREVSDDDTMIASTISWVGYFHALKTSQDIKVAEPFFSRAFELDPRNMQTVTPYFHLLTERRDEKCLKLVEAILPCADHLSDELIASIARCGQMTKTQINLPGDRRGLYVIEGGDSILEKNYLTMSKYLADKKIYHLAMQYPTLPILSLKELLKELKQREYLFFVSNEENFKSALLTKKYEELFTDRFRGSWGHATPEGNRMIAESAEKELEPILRKLASVQIQTDQLSGHSSRPLSEPR